jgi:glycosyltransferase involved in cell wall biosynthesis
VLVLVHGLGVGGAEVMIGHLARHLRAAGAQVEIGCLGELGRLGEELREEKFPVVVHARRPGFDPTLVARIARCLRSGRFDVVHLHQRTALVYGVLAGLLDATPLVYTEHGPCFGDRARRRLRTFNRLLGWRLRRVTAVSEALARELTEAEGLPAARIEVVPNAVDASWFEPPGAGARERARRAMGVAAEGPVVGAVGRLEPVKNHALLLHVAARLMERLPGLELVLIGEGNERARLEGLARELGIGDRVRLLGLRRDVRLLLRGFDVYCLSSLSEGIPLTVLEAMASGIPIVSTAVGGVGEAIRPDREGVLIAGAPPDSRRPASDFDRQYIERYAGAVERLLHDADLRRRLTGRARERAASLFSVPAVCRRYEDVLGGP